MRAAQVGTALNDLVGLLAADQQSEARELAARLAEDRSRLLVVGEAKRGKSTVVNALLGRVVVPTGVVPLTAIATVLRHGSQERCEVHFLNGRQESYPLDRLSQFVTETQNPGNHLGVAAVTVSVAAQLLASGVDLVDTPGIGSVHSHNSEEAERALHQMDAAVLVLSGDPPVTQGELELLRRLTEDAMAVFCLVNKTDLLSEGELDEVLDFTRSTVAQACAPPPPVWPISARNGLHSRLAQDADGVVASGLHAVESALADYLHHRRREDLVESTARSAARLTAAAAEECAARLAALDTAASDVESKLEAVEHALEQVNAALRDATAVAQVQVRALIAETDAQAAELGTQGLGPLQMVLRAFLSEPQNLAPAELERQGRELLIHHVQQRVEDWRTARVGVLSEQLNGLDQRLRAQLSAPINQVRRTVADLFELTLDDLPADVGLPPDPRFWYAFSPARGTTEELASLVRSHLPRTLARRRTTGYLIRELEFLLDQQIGRARADLQRRCEERLRKLNTALLARRSDGVERLAQGLREGADLRARSQPAQAAARTQLYERREELHRLVALFEQDRAGQHPRE